LSEYENRWFRVVREDQWYWIEQSPGTTGAAILPVSETGVILQRHFRASQGWSETIELPRGLCNPGEDEVTCALRELAEETGLALSAERLYPLGYMRPDAGLLSSRVALFWADCSEITPSRPRDGEAHEVFELSYADLFEWLRADRIEDSFTLACIARWIVDAPERFPLA